MFCTKCGNEIADGTNSCPKCGAVLTPPPSPIQQQPIYYASSMPNPETRPTSVGGWIGWWLLIYLLPVIGWIISICLAKDKTVKNGIIAYVIISVLLTIILSIVLFILTGSGLLQIVNILRYM